MSLLKETCLIYNICEKIKVAKSGQEVGLLEAKTQVPLT